MNSGVTLEAFEAPGLPLRIADFSAPWLEGDLHTAEESAAEAQALPADTEVPTPEEQREIERLEMLERIERCLRSIEQELRAAQAQAFRQLGERITLSVSKLLPHLIDSAGAAEIAASVVAIVEKSQQVQPVLDVSPEEYDQIVGHLAKLATPIQVQVRKAPATTPGTASLRWDGGGAEIDLNAFLQSARQYLDRAGYSPSTGVE